jgi:hypothetical protein
MFFDEPEYAAFWLGVARGELATFIQLTPYAYALLEGAHLVGIAFFFGSIFVLDLRLLGSTPSLAAGPADRFLLRICVPAFAVLVVTGVLLFVPSADRFASSPAFLLKLGVIALGGVNALAFYRAAHAPGETDRRRSKRAVWTARTAAVVSVAVWVGAIALGRSMGYERREPPPSDLDTMPWLGAENDGTYD